MACGKETSNHLSSQPQPSGSNKQDQCDITQGNQCNRGTKSHNSTKFIRSLVSKKDFICSKVQSFQKNLSSLRTKCNQSPKKERKSPKRERKSPKKECRSPKKAPDKHSYQIEDDPFNDAEGSPIHLEKIHSICSELSNYQICFVEFVDAEVNEVERDDCDDMAVKRKTEVITQPPLNMEETYNKSCSNKEGELEEEKNPVEEEATGTDIDMAKSLDKEELDAVTDRLPQVEDDLPLGSEGNKFKLKKANTFASETLGSKLNMFLDKRLAMLKSSPQGVSFDSNNTSSSSINSVDMLLRERSEDPEQVLLNLGFGGSFHHDMGSSYNRIPERFLLNNSRAKGINLEEFLEDNPELKTFVGTLKKKGSRSGAWKAARSMSTVINQLRLSLTASRQKAVAQSDVQDDYPKSILIPENQRALAAQGFYTQHLGFKQKTGQSSSSETPKLTEELLKLHTENNNVKDAAAKRKMFQKTHSKKWSLLTEEQNEDSSASFDYSRSMDFSTSNSMDSSDNPFSPDIRTSSISDLRRQIDLDVSKKMDEAYFPYDSDNRENVGISDLRRRQVDRLSIDEDDGDYTVSPPISKQSTVERVKTLSSGSVCDDQTTDQVQIVVSQDIENEIVFADDKNEQKSEFENMKYLSIGSAGSDRLSDTESSSDHTVVDKVSSLDSPDIIENNQNHLEFPPLSSKQYDEKVAEDKSVIEVTDENENFPLFKFIKTPLNQETPSNKSSPAHGEDLSRMGSLQSDSSGFGDAEYSVDVTPHESDLLKFSNLENLGSSSESAATLASSVSTILARDLDKNNSQVSLEEGDYFSQMPTFSWQTQPSLRDELNDELQSNPKQTYISTCYIPIVGKNYRHPYSTFHRPEIRAVDNHVSILVTNASVERTEERTCETRESVYKNRRLEPPTRESMFKELSSPSNSSIAANSDSYLSSPELGYGHNWQRTGYRRSQFSKSRFRYGSGESILTESDYSYCSTPDSIASCNHGDMMDYHKLVKLINQPVNIQGYKRSIIQYKPKKHVKEWNNLLRKKRLQEETCMLQYAIQKYKTELHSLETAFMVQFQQAYEELSEEERDEVEELQHLWTAIHQQLLETERLLSQRLKKISSGNDFFTYISSLSVLQRMILLLREQLYQQQITVGKDELDVVNQNAQLPLFKSQSCMGLDLPPPFTSYPNLTMPSRVGHSLEELRDSIIKDVKEEMKKSTQNLHLDMKSKEEEIQRLQFELMVEKYRKEENPNSVVETDV